MSAARDVIENCEAIKLVCEQAQRSPLLIADGVVRALSTAGYRIVGPGEVENLRKALSKAEDNAGTLPAREAVKLHPVDWNFLAAAIRALGGKDA